ncbi:Small integral membrane protein 14 [Eumeta japonica]|uniref:Small integral membrane protein 14 n=1 Tax=Eumeta variegata TaxID=151549 RepID=A0A4C1TIW4_EUMVA|nr:Small integral membrane protein 14 [Eumeta japonica]
MADEGMDPCECIWNHELAMRRLISLLRQGQSYCTDNECLEELPGLPQAESANNFLMMFMMMAVAMAMYAMRPRRRRQIEAAKPAQRDSQLLSRALSAATKSRNSITKIKPNAPYFAYHVARPSIRLMCMYMVRLYEARTDRDKLLRNQMNMIMMALLPLRLEFNPGGNHRNDLMKTWSYVLDMD